MTNLLLKWWARLEVILQKERVNPFDVRSCRCIRLTDVTQNDFGRLTFDKGATTQAITTQEEVLLMNARTMFPGLATTKLLTAKGLQTCKSILNHNSFDSNAYRIGLRVVRKVDAINDLKQLQSTFELPQDSLPPTVTIGKGKSSKNDWYGYRACRNMLC